MNSQGIAPELVLAAVGGDKTAIANLLTLAQPDIRKYAGFHCSSREDAEDASQETLWLLSRRIGTLRTVAAFPGWLMMIVRRECARLAGKFRHAELTPHEPFASRPDIELRLDVAAAIESLPEHYRRLVVLRDLQDMTVDEIARDVGLSREAVKGRLHRARVLMREYLSK